MDINRIADYYGQAPIIFGDIFKETLPSGTSGAERETASEYSGLVFMLEGKARFSMNQTPYEIEPWIVLHAGPSMALSKEAIGDAACSFIVVHYWMPSEEIANYPLYNDHFLVRMGTSARAVELVSDLLKNYQLPGGIAALKTKILFINLIQEMILSAKRQFQDTDSEIIEQAVSYLCSHYAESLTIEEVAKKFGFNQRRFTYLFERETGMSPMNYLTDLRMRRSKEMLRSYTCPVAQIAEWVGYADSFYFSRIFKKYTGMSPSEYREKTKTNSR